MPCDGCDAPNPPSDGCDTPGSPTLRLHVYAANIAPLPPGAARSHPLLPVYLALAAGLYRLHSRPGALIVGPQLHALGPPVGSSVRRPAQLRAHGRRQALLAVAQRHGPLHAALCADRAGRRAAAGPADEPKGRARHPRRTHHLLPADRHFGRGLCGRVDVALSARGRADQRHAGAVRHPGAALAGRPQHRSDRALDDEPVGTWAHRASSTWPG